MQKSLSPDSSSKFIRWLFRGRCVGVQGVCWNAGTDRSHIVPKSRGKSFDADWKNIVLHCRKCHETYHRLGVNDLTIAQLQQRRKDFLISIGRKDYI